MPPEPLGDHLRLLLHCALGRVLERMPPDDLTEDERQLLRDLAQRVFAFVRLSE